MLVDHAMAYDERATRQPTLSGPSTPQRQPPISVIPVARAGAARWERVTAKLNRPFQPHPAARARTSAGLRKVRRRGRPEREEGVTGCVGGEHGRDDGEVATATPIRELARGATGLVRPAFVVAKGGITSSDVVTAGLGIRRAWVRGTLLPGIVSLWEPVGDGAL